MTRRNKAHKLLVSAFALLTAFAVAGIDLEILAQNTNSSTTGDTTSAQNTNTGTTRRGNRRRNTRTRRTRSGNTNTGAADDASMTNTNTSDDASMQNTNSAGEGTMTGTTQGRGRRGGRRGRRAATATDASMTDASAGQSTGTGADAAGGTQAGEGRGAGTAGTEQDLSGTYTGTINAPDWGLSGPATLTITGNTFTLDAGGNTQSGTLSARSWPGYVAVSMRFGTGTPANIVSLRARHRGQSLTLTSVPGENKQFSFTTGGGGGGRPPARPPERRLDGGRAGYAGRAG
jgi:hypothetical protein